MMQDGKNLSQIAVLVRAGFQTREFEERFIAIGRLTALSGRDFMNGLKSVMRLLICG